MRSVNRLAAVAAALALSACGDWSNEDVRFLSALPTREDLHVAVPPPASAAGALQACTDGPASLWLSAKPTSDGLNAAVDVVVTLVDAVRRQPPTARADDLRRWGPFDDQKHPGREVQVIITRQTGPDGGVVHAFSFEARVKGDAGFTPVLTGTFEGPSARAGAGSLELSFEALRALGLADADTPHGVMVAHYDRTSDPRTVHIGLDQGGFGVERFEYGYAGYAAGGGWFEYVIRKGLARLTITSSFDAAGAGRAQVSYLSFAVQGSFRQCWDAAACLVYVDDPGNYSCNVGPSLPACSLGAVTACPAVPAPPF
jgi:hypothetical protein